MSGCTKSDFGTTCTNKYKITLFVTVIHTNVTKLEGTLLFIEIWYGNTAITDIQLTIGCILKHKINRFRHF